MVNINRAKIRQVLASVDWGFTNPGVIQVWLVDNDGRMYLVREVYRTRQTIDWWVDKAKALKKAFDIETFFCDPAEPEHIQRFTAAGLSARPAMNNIALGIQAVQERLQSAGDGKPRLFILRNCLDEIDEDLQDARKPTCVADEIGGYVWAKGKDGKPTKEAPEDVDNHGLDALRYAVMAVDNYTTPMSKTKAPGLYPTRKVMNRGPRS